MSAEEFRRLFGRGRPNRFSPEGGISLPQQGFTPGYDIIESSGYVAPGVIVDDSFASTIDPVLLRTTATLTAADAIAHPNRVAFNTDNAKLYRSDGATWTTLIPTTDLSGQVTTAQIVDSAITEIKLGASAVTAAKLAVDAVTSSAIAAGAVTSAELDAAAVILGKIAADAVDTAAIAASAVTTSELAALSVTAAKIVANTITAGQIAAATITATEIAALTITAAQIAANTITAAKIVAGTITTTEIAALTIVAGNIAAATITGAKIAANTITAGNIQALTITAAEIAANTITAGKISAGAIGTTELSASAVISLVSNVGATVVINSSGITIANGKLFLQDAFGASVLGAAGFSGDWATFIATGLYNGQFLSGVVGTIANGRTVALPYWTTSDVAGTPTLAFLSGGGVKLSPGALNDKKRLVSDSVPVRPKTYYYMPYTVSANATGGAAMKLTLTIEWYKADGSASATATTLFGTFSTSSAAFPISGGNVAPKKSPEDAVFAKVRLEVSEETAHNAANYMTLWSSGLILPPPATLDTLSYTFAGLNVTDGTGVTTLSGDGRVTTGGTSFPVAASDNDQFYRTDLDAWFFYNSSLTRWLSTTLYQLPISGAQRATGMPIAATVAANWLAATPPLEGGSDIWLSHADVAFMVNSGGTALGASHKWVGNLAKAVDASTTETSVATFNIASGTSGVWRGLSVAIDAVMNGGTTHRMFTLSWTKTGTPGTLYVEGIVTYRIVAT